MNKTIRNTIRSVVLVFIMTIMLVPLVHASSAVESVGKEYFDVRGDVVIVDFEDARLEPGDQYRLTHGVSFSGDSSTILRISDYNRGGNPTSSGQFSIANDANYPGTSSNKALEIEFENGALAFGFYAGNGNAYGEQVTASIGLYDKAGNLLHATKRSDITNNVETFIGFTSDEPIYSVTLNYISSVLSEEIDDVMFVPTREVGELSCGTIVSEDDQFKLGSFTVEYRKSDDSYSDDPKVHIKVLNTGETIERPVSFDITGKATFDVKLGGNVWHFTSASSTDYNDWDIKLDCPVSSGSGGGGSTILPYKPKVLPYHVWTRSYDKTAQGTVAKYVHINGKWVLDSTTASHLVDGMIVSPDGKRPGSFYTTDLEIVEEEVVLFLSFYNDQEIPTVLHRVPDVHALAQPVQLTPKVHNDRLTICSYTQGCSRTYSAHAQELLYTDGEKFWTKFDMPASSGSSSGGGAGAGKLVKSSACNEVIRSEDYKADALWIQGETYDFEVVDFFDSSVVVDFDGQRSGRMGIGGLFMDQEKEIQLVVLRVSGISADFFVNCNPISFNELGDAFYKKRAELLALWKSQAYAHDEPIPEGDVSEGFAPEGYEPIPESEDYSETYEEEEYEILPLPQVEPVPKEECSSGCSYEEKCLPIGSRIKSAEGTSFYCDFNGKMQKQALEGSYCENNFECSTNSCLSGQCVDLNKRLEEQQNLLEKIWKWLSNLFL